MDISHTKSTSRKHFHPELYVKYTVEILWLRCGGEGAIQ